MLSVGSAGQQSAASGVSRRDFLRVGGLSVLGLSAAEQAAQQRALAEARGKGARRCIFLLLTGGPGPLETFDPKPNAPAEFRGPFRAISTSISGISLSETLPLLAQRLDKVSLVRSLWHDATPIHETGQQLIQTGRLARGAIIPPSLGSIVSRLLGSRNSLPAYAVLPAPLGNTGVEMWQGQRAGFLGAEFEPWHPLVDLPAAAQVPQTPALQAAVNWAAEPESVTRAYGETPFGRSCWMARRLVESGVRFVTANMFDSLADRITWDCHANGRWAPGTLSDYRHVLCPDFDRAFTALIDDLDRRGLLEETLVVATGEFGRTPRINEHGGRDHWSGVWSAVVAGGGMRGGQVIGASDGRGIAPVDRPVTPSELAATILHNLGLDLDTTFAAPGNIELPLSEYTPIQELAG